jgi:hypothetical protein
MSASPRPPGSSTDSALRMPDVGGLCRRKKTPGVQRRPGVLRRGKALWLRLDGVGPLLLWAIIPVRAWGRQVGPTGFRTDQVVLSAPSGS